VEWKLEGGKEVWELKCPWRHLDLWVRLLMAEEAVQGERGLSLGEGVKWVCGTSIGLRFCQEWGFYVMLFEWRLCP
jgi:hypothetical protein